MSITVKCWPDEGFGGDILTYVFPDRESAEDFVNEGIALGYPSTRVEIDGEEYTPTAQRGDAYPGVDVEDVVNGNIIPDFDREDEFLSVAAHHVLMAEEA